MKFIHTFRRWTLKHNPQVTIRGTKAKCHVWWSNPFRTRQVRVTANYVTFDDARPIARGLAARSEGWDIFRVDGGLCVQRIDDPDSYVGMPFPMPKLLESDAAAIILARAAGLICDDSGWIPGFQRL